MSIGVRQCKECNAGVLRGPTGVVHRGVDVSASCLRVSDNVSSMPLATLPTAHKHMHEPLTLDSLADIPLDKDGNTV